VIVLTIVFVLLALMCIGDDSGGGLLFGVLFLGAAVFCIMRYEHNDMKADLRKAGFELIDSDTAGLSSRNKANVTVEANGNTYRCSAEDIDGTWKIVDKDSCKEQPVVHEPKDLENQ